MSEDRNDKKDDRYVRVAALKNADLFRRHLDAGGIDLPFDATLAPPAPMLSCCG